MFVTIQTDLSSDGVLTVILNRPDRLNAFTPTMCRELRALFQQVNRDDEVRAIVVTGAGRAFCAGMDLSDTGNPFGLDEDVELTLEELGRRMEEPEVINGVRDTGGLVTLPIHHCLKPVIAAINGPAVGIGATMTLAMDFRLAAHGARIGFVFGKLGITPEACSTYFLPHLVGMQQALEWVYTAEVFPVEEAHAKGLVRSLHAPEDLLAAARDLAVRITQGRSATAIAATRRMMRVNPLLGPEHAHKTESLAVHWLSQKDGAEGVAAFRERRAPEFRGLTSQDLPPGFDNWHRSS